MLPTSGLSLLMFDSSRGEPVPLTTYTGYGTKFTTVWFSRDWENIMLNLYLSKNCKRCMLTVLPYFGLSQMCMSFDIRLPPLFKSPKVYKEDPRYCEYGFVIIWRPWSVISNYKRWTICEKLIYGRV